MTDVTGGHQQICVKVNTPVDSGVAHLVEALSSFPELCTLSSCQGAAFVSFRLERPICDQALFLCWFRRNLASEATISAEWGGQATLLFTLRCHPASITLVSSAVTKIGYLWRSLLDDNPCKEFDNSQTSLTRLSKWRRHDPLASPIADLMWRDLCT